MSEEGGEITIDARRFADVWANAVRVNGSHDEITPLSFGNWLK